MKLGVMAAVLADLDLDEACARCRTLGLDAIELPVGGYPGSPFFDAAELLASPAASRRVTQTLAEHGLVLSAISVHGNPVHPDPDRAAADHAAFERAVRLARHLGTDTVITFSGCPGGAPGDRATNWVTCAWPPDNQEILRYQWDDVLVPYWATQAKLAQSEGVRIAWEAHPGFAVYNPRTLLELSARAQCAAGLSGPPVLGANIDPSHFFWQGIDPVEAARIFGEAGVLFACHAKDCGIDRSEVLRDGVLDARSYGDPNARAWIFRTCGWGHDETFWRRFISMLRRQNFDGVLSIEHEDLLMSRDEGLGKAVAFLRPLVPAAPPADPWWC